jgi:hypothetical protein
LLLSNFDDRSWCYGIDGAELDHTRIAVTGKGFGMIVAGEDDWEDEDDEECWFPLLPWLCPRP